MKITAIPQLYRNLKRWREILAVLRRYGLADWLTQFQLPFRDALKDPGGVPLSNYTREQRVKMALTDLGPTFIKLGQVLAARPDLVGPSLAEELKSLRASVPADSIEQVRETLRQELGEDYEKHFTKIESRPLATASVGQVHKAKLKDGNAVVIKVLRSEIEPTVRQDMEVLTGLAQLAEHVDAFAVWRPSDMVRQLAPMITREIDFARERQNLEHFGEVFDSHESGVLIPRAVRELCTRRVLVMEEITGTPLSDFLRDYKEQSSHQQQAFSDPTDQSSEQGAIDGSRANKSSSTKDRLAEKLADVYLAMIFDEGLFHADPHPGNLIVASDGRLGILDFGMVGRIDENLRESIEEMLIAISQSDQYRLTRLIRRIGDAPLDLDESLLAIDVAEFIGTFGRQRLGEFDMTGAINSLSELLHRHAITLPNQSALLLKMLISLEGTLRELGASFDSLEMVRNFVRRVMRRRLSPERRLRQVRRIYHEAESFLESAPEELVSLMRQTRKGELRVVLEHQRIGPTVNRLVLGLMASAVFLGSSLLMAMKVPPLLFQQEALLGMQDISLLGVVGVFGSFSVMMWLLIAIRRTGHLTRGNEGK
ncbi:MAG: ABC1 kinase family protein [Rubripirellula sp.]